MPTVSAKHVRSGERVRQRYLPADEAREQATRDKLLYESATSYLGPFCYRTIDDHAQTPMIEPLSISQFRRTG